MNVPLSPHTTGETFRRAYDELAAPAIDAFAPTWVLVSAGFDGHRLDPLADLSLTSADFADVGASLASIIRGPGRLQFFLEGGYDLDALRTSVGAVAATALGTHYRPEPPSSGGPGDGMIDAVAIRRANALERALA